MNKKAFTLVELLVVITVVSILGTIATYFVFGNISESRDASRVSNLTSIATVLENYFIEESQYPVPDNGVDILYGSGVAWTQGEFGSEVTRKLESFGSDIPKDPRFDTFFTYSTTNKEREYQIATIAEGNQEEEGLGEITLIDRAHAAIPTAIVRGDYNNVLVRVRDGNQDYFLATPSIIASDISVPDASDIITQRKLVYNEFFNLPSTYSGSLNLNGGFDFNVSDPLIFSGSTIDLKTKAGLESFSQKLRFIYATTPTENFDQYISLLEEDGFLKLKQLLTRNFKILFRDYFSCREIFDDGGADGNKLYSIDPDGSGPLPEENIYCDMTTGGGGWTRVGDNHITGGDFLSGSGIVSHPDYPGLSSGNQIVSINTPVGTNALYQTGDNETNYEVGFDDISVLEPGYEIRMSAWVTGNDGQWTNKLGLNPQEGYIFHNRINYEDGTFSTNGTPEGLETMEINGNIWQLQQVRHIVRKNPIDFQWFIGLDTEDTKSLHMAGIRLEVFHGGYNNNTSRESILSFNYTGDTGVVTPILLDILWVGNNSATADQQDVIDSLLLDGHSVTFIDDNVNTDGSLYDVVFIHEDVNSGTAWSNISNLLTHPGGIVTSETHLFDNLLGLQTGLQPGNTSINITNNSHPITSGFTLGNLEIGSNVRRVNLRSGETVPGELAQSTGGHAAIATWESGDLLYGSFAPASGRRAIVPIGNESGRVMNNAAKDLLKNTILWAGGALE